MTTVINNFTMTIAQICALLRENKRIVIITNGMARACAIQKFIMKLFEDKLVRAYLDIDFKIDNQFKTININDATVNMWKKCDVLIYSSGNNVNISSSPVNFEFDQCISIVNYNDVFVESVNVARKYFGAPKNVICLIQTAFDKQILEASFDADMRAVYKKYFVDKITFEARKDDKVNSAPSSPLARRSRALIRRISSMSLIKSS